MGLCRRFARDRGGNFALLSCVAAVPLVLGVGVSLDLATISRTETELQNAIDSAALAVAREGRDIELSRARQIARDYLHENHQQAFRALALTRTGTAVTVKAASDADMTFGQLFGYDTWPVVASATADFASVPYEIALVLDTTGSMAGGKMQAMKDAVLGLIDTMSINVTDEKQLKMAVVPFATFVNVGPQFGPAFTKKGRVKKGTGAPWLDLAGVAEIPQLELKKGVSRFEVFHNLQQDWAGCVESRHPTKKVAYDVTDAAPNPNKPASLFVPALSIDEPDAGYGNSYIASDVDPLDKSLANAIRKLKKYGLVGNLTQLLGLSGSSDDDDDDDDDDDSGTGSTESGSSGNGTDSLEWTPVSAETTTGKGPNAGCDMQPIAPLTSDYAALKARIESLEASGTTNIMEGVAWGWRVLSPGEPFTEGAKKNAGTQKIMILLTDGSNNFGTNGTALGSSYSSFGFAVDQRLGAAAVTASSTNSAMNDKTLAACTNAKADGVEIFTIRLEEPDKTTGMMLKDCATDADHFFDAPSRTQLDEVFQKIRDRITKVRITS